MQIYRAFGLGSSYADVLRFDCLLRYSEYEAEDRGFPEVPSRLLEDIYQVGRPLPVGPGWPVGSGEPLENRTMSLCSRWEETSCWTTWGRFCSATAAERRWTGRRCRTSCGRRRPRSAKRRGRVGTGTDTTEEDGRFHTLMRSRLALAAPRRHVTETQVWSDGCSTRRCRCQRSDSKSDPFLSDHVVIENAKC